MMEVEREYSRKSQFQYNFFVELKKGFPLISKFNCTKYTIIFFKLKQMES